MNLAWFRFYEELNDFLPAGKREMPIPHSFRGSPSVKDAVEALGVPHVEIDLILVNSRSVDFSYKIRNADYISVYPVFESFDITPVTHLRSKPLRDLKFVLDVHLGKLARYIRLCGFDTLYRTDLDDDEIIRLSLEEKRAILTRDIGLLKNRRVLRGYWIRSLNIGEQMKEVFRRFDLNKQINLFTRCMECNSVLNEVAKDDIVDRLMPKTREYYHEFKICRGCNRIYWDGSHYKRMKEFITDLSCQFFENGPATGNLG